MLLAAQSDGPFPPTIPQKYIDNPNVLLDRGDRGNEHILGHITIHLDSKAVRHESPISRSSGNMENAFNTPFAANAFVESARATFWIEWVGIPRISDPENGAMPADQGD